MTAADMLEDSFPHGTMNGYRQGCKTGHCPAPITCTDLRTRYQGDWAFRKRVDAGWTVEQLAAADAAAVEAAREAERAANRAIRATEKAARASRKPSTGMHGRGRSWTTEELDTLRTMRADGKNDKEIAAVLGRPHQSVQCKRQDLGLPSVPVARRVHGTLGMYSRGGCKGDDCPSTPTCGEIGRAYYREKQRAYAARAKAAA